MFLTLAAPSHASTTHSVDARTCTEFQDAAHSIEQDWACFGGVVTYYDQNGQTEAIRALAGSEPASPPRSTGASRPLAIVDEYTSNVTEPIIASLNGVGYRIPVSVKTRIYNHSPRITMSYSSSKPISVVWSVRVRRDNNLRGDDTVYNYADAYGSSYLTTMYSTTEDQYGDGYNALPYDGKRYFIDLHAIRLYDGKKVLNVAGSVQSDRMTCYKTVSCKFR